MGGKMRAVLRKELLQHRPKDDEAERGLAEQERCREALAGVQDGGGGTCAGMQAAVTSAVSTGLPPREGTEQSVPVVHGHSGRAGVCFDFHPQYQGEPWYNPQTSQEVDSSKSDRKSVV